MGIASLLLAWMCVWLFQLSDEVQSKLESKTFLPPMHFYAAPKMWAVGQSLPILDVVQVLRDRGYQARDAETFGANQRLQPAEFLQLSQVSNPDQIQRLCLTAASSCLLLRNKKTLDPGLKDLPLQIVVWRDEKISQIFRTTSGDEKPSDFPVVELEPLLVAQFLGQEPIQQFHLSLGEIPTLCLRSVLAIEDARFLEHQGVSMTSLARAFVKNLLGKGYSQGGSTITQQLVKNYFLTPEKTLRRKWKEFFIALILENKISKDQILETYLNIIYLGQNGIFQVRGFPAASEFYFGKPIQGLDLNSCATLAAILNSPGLYDPTKRPELLWKRRNLVLEKLFDNNWITAEEKANAQAQALALAPRPQSIETFPYYLDFVQKELKEKGMPLEGVQVFTGLQPTHQTIAQESLQKTLSGLEKENKKIQTLLGQGKKLEAAWLSAQVSTGLIQAVIGGRNFKNTQFNRAREADRQVGSIVKPFIFLTALNTGKYSPVSILNDQPFTYQYQNQSWSPENYYKEYYQEVPMYFALKNSLNTATAKLGLDLGLENVVKTLQQAGLQKKIEILPSLLLGAFELKPFEVLQLYQSLANRGSLRKASALRFVLGSQNQSLYSNPNLNEGLKFDSPWEEKKVAQLISMMQQTFFSGTAKTFKNLTQQMEVAGKTGTTSDYKDSWFAGFNPQTVAVAWVGFDDNTPSGLTGASGALPIWGPTMQKIFELDPQKLQFSAPEGLKKKSIEPTPPDQEPAELLVE